MFSALMRTFCRPMPMLVITPSWPACSFSRTQDRPTHIDVDRLAPPSAQARNRSFIDLLPSYLQLMQQVRIGLSRQLKS
jgi:hypothetical protein